MVGDRDNGIPSIGSMVLCYYGFGPWYCERPKAIKEEGDHLARVCLWVEYLKVS